MGNIMSEELGNKRGQKIKWCPVAKTIYTGVHLKTCLPCRREYDKKAYHAGKDTRSVIQEIIDHTPGHGDKALEEIDSGCYRGQPKIKLFNNQW